MRSANHQPLSRKKSEKRVNKIKVGEKLGKEGIFASVKIQRPVFVSFKDHQPYNHSPTKNYCNGFIHTNSRDLCAQTTEYPTVLVTENNFSKVLGIIVNRNSAIQRTDRNIKVIHYKFSYDTQWYTLTGEKTKIPVFPTAFCKRKKLLKVKDIEELIVQKNKLTGEPIENVFVEDKSRKIKSTIPQNARLIGGIKTYKIDDEEFQEETVFVMEQIGEERIPTITGEIVDKETAEKKDYIPNYLLENENRSLTQLTFKDQESGEMCQMTASDVFGDIDKTTSKKRKDLAIEKKKEVSISDTFDGSFFSSRLYREHRETPKKIPMNIGGSTSLQSNKPVDISFQNQTNSEKSSPDPYATEKESSASSQNTYHSSQKKFLSSGSHSFTIFGQKTKMTTSLVEEDLHTRKASSFEII